MQDIIRGRVWVLGHDVDTDGIIGGKYLTILDPQVLKQHVFEIALPEFAANAQPGDIIVAAGNFGSGSSREAAPQALRAAKVGAVVAESFARIFFRNCINLGVPAVEAPGVRAIFERHDPARLEMRAGRVVNERTNQEVRFPPLPPHLLELLESGGLVEKVRRELAAQRAAKAAA
jgi:3-isopropylmalate/(R)-2-methylmalate dehydratase small subunit